MINISIITPTLNAGEIIFHCIESVQEQKVAYEHIIIDGGSDNPPAKVLESFQSSTIKVITGKDNGVYDAMNKGISFATGDIIGILNADDFYAQKDVLRKVAAVFEDRQTDACYGDLVYVDREKIDRIFRYWRSGKLKEKSFYWGWMPPHPTFFVRRKIYETYGGFNLNVGSSADYELMLRFLLKHRIATVYIPEVLVKMRVGGVSNASVKNRMKAHKTDRLSWAINELKPYPWTISMKPLRKLGQYFCYGAQD